MRKLILLFLLIPALVFADQLIINGSRTVYNKDLKKHTFDYDPPTNPQVNEMFTDLDNNNTYIWDGDSWELERKDTQIKAIIADTNNIIAGTAPESSANLVKRLKNVEKAIYIFYKEQY